jgi:hypothetical protein
VSKFLISVSNAGESHAVVPVLGRGVRCCTLAVKHPSSQAALCEYFVERGEHYWTNIPDAAFATYITFTLLANHLYVDDEVEVVSEHGEERTLPWHEVQKAICDKLQTPDGLVRTIIDLISDVEEDDVLGIGDDDHPYKTRDEFFGDINWEKLADSSKMCWLLVCMNSK